jgi:ankyrin repeat protein
LNQAIQIQVNWQGETALIQAIENNMPDIAMKLLDLGLSNLEQETKFLGHTALMMACRRNMTQVAMRLIDLPSSAVEHITKNRFAYGSSALSVACDYNMEDVAMKLIETGLLKQEIENTELTFIFWACRRGLSKVALKIIDLNLANPKYLASNADIDSENCNELFTEACDNNMTEVALKLIEMRCFNSNKLDGINNTPLLLACKKEMSQVALALIETGLSNPLQTDKDGNTALIIACQNKMVDVAIELIPLTNGFLQHYNHHQNHPERGTAWDFANANKLLSVVDVMSSF